MLRAISALIIFFLLPNLQANELKIIRGVKEATGIEYMTVFAAYCDDDGYKAIEKWAKSIKFEKMKLPKFEGVADKLSIKSQDEAVSIIYSEDKNNVSIVVKNKIYAAKTPCLALAQVLTSRGEHAYNNSFFNLLVSEAQAQSSETPKYEQSRREEISISATVTSFFSGCLELDCMGGVKKEKDKIAKRNQVNKEIYEKSLLFDLGQFDSGLRSGAARFEACTDDFVQISMGDKTLKVFKKGRLVDIEVRGGGTLLHKYTTPWDRIGGEHSSVIFRSQFCDTPEEAVRENESMNRLRANSCRRMKGVVACPTVERPAIGPKKPRHKRATQ